MGFALRVILPIAIFALAIGILLIIPTIINFFLGEKFKRRIFIVGVIAIELSILTFLFLKPVVTYSNQITSEIKIHNQWAPIELKRYFGHIYSSAVPLIPYRYNVTELSNSEVTAKIYYFPVGNIEVNILKTINGYEPDTINNLIRNN